MQRVISCFDILIRCGIKVAKTVKNSTIVPMFMKNKYFLYPLTWLTKCLYDFRKYFLNFWESTIVPMFMKKIKKHKK